MQETTFKKEQEVISQGEFLVVGVDEAGRGPLAGPVVACATTVRNIQFLNPNFQIGSEEEEKKWKLVRDSKKLSEKQREEMFDFVQEYFFVGVGIVHAETIDRINILEATFLAMKSAIASLKQQLVKNDKRVRDEDFYLLIDGNQEIPNLSLKQETVVGGDGRVKSIAAASIIAKVTRDRMIIEYDKLYPAYGLAQHKGYGTKVHMEALRKYGPTPIHRMSFKPVQLSLPENVNKRFSNVLKPKKK